MRRAIGLVQISRQLPQHRGVAIDRANRCSFGIGQRWQSVIGAEDIGRPVHEVEVLFWLGHAALLAGLLEAR